MLLESFSSKSQANVMHRETNLTDWEAVHPPSAHVSFTATRTTSPNVPGTRRLKKRRPSGSASPSPQACEEDSKAASPCQHRPFRALSPLFRCGEGRLCSNSNSKSQRRLPAASLSPPKLQLLLPHPNLDAFTVCELNGLTGRSCRQVKGSEAWVWVDIT
jgi:hypothetical protein